MKASGAVLRFGIIAIIFLVGCGAEPEQAQEPVQAKLVPGLNAPLSTDVKPRPKRKPKPSLNLELDPPTQQTVRIGSVIHPEVSSLLRMIKQSRAESPTLVAWIMDRSKSASNMVDAVKLQTQSFYEDLMIEQKQSTASGSEEVDSPPLLTAVYSFAENTEKHLEPTADIQSVVTAFSQIAVDASGIENGFTALQEATQDALDYRTKQGFEVILVVVTDEAGDDQKQAESLRGDLAKYAIPVYVIGVNAPFGKRSILPEHVEAGAAPTEGRTFINQGPETRDMEQLLLEYPGSSLGVETVDSGFGPFAWEYLCRVSGGSFLSLKAPGYTSSMLNRPGSRPVALIGTYDRTVLQKYAPDYISESEYAAKLESNLALRALIQVSRLNTIGVLKNPRRDFVYRDEATLSRELGQAQLSAAQLEPALNRAYEILSQGEADRDKILKPRWQAGFDLAMGRLLAARSRVEGYNAMLALMKRGKRFEKETSTTWVLVPSNESEAGSVIKKMGQRAVEYLQRVKTEHAGTPWARMADLELQSPVGWQWNEQ
ncbi:MAG: hypothetical protein VX738_12640 [Planctomycetota bacterium]|nr:hypothetical protein [Planctomycetota bacterium]